MAVSAESPCANGRIESCCCACEAGSARVAAARTWASTHRNVVTPRPGGSSLYLLLKKDPAELVFLARLQDRQYLVTRLELGRPDCDLRGAVAHDRDEPRAFRQPQLLHRLAGGRRFLVDLDLDDLEVLLPQLEQMHEVVLRDLVLDEPKNARGRAHRRRDAEQVEVRLVPRIVDTRDDLLDAVLLLGELRDHEVVLVVSGEGEDEIRGTLDP